MGFYFCLNLNVFSRIVLQFSTVCVICLPICHHLWSHACRLAPVDVYLRDPWAGGCPQSLLTSDCVEVSEKLGRVAVRALPSPSPSGDISDRLSPRACFSSETWWWGGSQLHTPSSRGATRMRQDKAYSAPSWHKKHAWGCLLYGFQKENASQCI